jgi:cyanophycinase
MERTLVLLLALAFALPATAAANDPFVATTIAAAEAIFIAGGDTHFAASDRMARDLAFLCRIVGNGHVCFIRAPGPAEVCEPATPLTYRNVDVYRIDATGGSFDLVRWAGKNGTAYQLSAEAGVLSSTQPDGSAY